MLPTGSHGPCVRVGGVVDVSDAQEIRWSHHAQLLVLKLQDDAFERIGKLWEGKSMPRFRIEPFKHAPAECQDWHRSARIANDFQSDIQKQFSHLPLLVGGETPAARRGPWSVVAAKENLASHRCWSRTNKSGPQPLPVN
jgi:hypothetical protein